MTRKTFLTTVSVIATSIGLFVLLAPGVLIADVKMAQPSDTANVMARTVGILLVAMGVLDFLVRDHDDSPTLKAVLVANLVLQVGILPIDPLAYATGVFTTLGSFLPNTVLHLVLASGFAYYVLRMGRARDATGAA